MLPTAALNMPPHDASVLDHRLRFLWLELTNRCNLTCAHCYAESGPHPATPDALTKSDYETLLKDAAALDCRAVQFIGGEPTLHRDLPSFIELARKLEYEFVEVYTNGTRLSDALLRCFVEHRVNIAVSVYSDDPAIHDAVTGNNGSHRRTMTTLGRMKDAGLAVRIGVISMERNEHRIDETLSYLSSLGFDETRVDYARSVGRGSQITQGYDGLQALCGACWQGSICVGADGKVSPCIMSKGWSVGSVPKTSLASIAEGDALLEVRRLIRDEVWLPRQAGGAMESCPPDCNPKCEPVCPPCMPLCTPTCPPPCTPVTGKNTIVMKRL